MIIGLIPARYKSSRLPGKPLLKLGEYNMIQRVYLQANKSELIDKNYVLTDDERIVETIKAIGGNVLLIKDECLNGTERICIALKKYSELFQKAKWIVNIQGDEPFINPNNIDTAIKKMNNDITCSTLHYKITNFNDLNDKSIGKLVLNKKGHIIYCSRNCIPGTKNKIDKNFNYYAHIGLFVFNIDYLQNDYMKENTPLQIMEDIEWLKIIEQDKTIVSTLVEDYEIGINTKKDYDYIRKKYNI